MAKIIDRFLLVLFSLAAIAALIFCLMASFGFVPFDDAKSYLTNIYNDNYTAVTFIAVCIVLLIIAFRLLFIAIRPSSNSNVPSIDQRTEFGDIKISVDTIENLALKAATRSRGVRDLKARVKVSNAGLDIELRTVVDGETSIPTLIEEIQAAVKNHLEDITGIPTASVSVYVANVAQSANTFKSRVE
ncbi:alkaline shock response membrane anchor protein AmaP [Gorillibacterium massiliense]|uniref:alkaline shock response membrane anchor protein AmaP n=1 Tax=Gorillibacterium massiliense TaxID=1280390 RepID=UPI00059472E8|nr:alkaline shock response membrane anchor protein AmaP [Gorillibacterium massiliense]